ncbi:MAG: cupin domain-containing protein [Rhizobium sp.]|nr:cupin domain-containing protein [Rhizobium sp.]
MHADVNERVVVATQTAPWHATADGEGACKPLDSLAAGAGTTSLVQAPAGAVFASPGGALGEEILVLDGTLTDARGVWRAGAYLRNPPGAEVAMHSETGCTLFIKRLAFDAEDTAAVRLDTASMSWLPGLVPGLTVMPLHEHAGEHTALVRWQPETFFQSHAHFGGEEILVLDGVFEDEFGRYPAGSWLRSPHMSRHQPFSREGCTIFVKVGHLGTGQQ